MCLLPPRIEDREIGHPRNDPPRRAVETSGYGRLNASPSHDRLRHRSAQPGETGVAGLLGELVWCGQAGDLIELEDPVRVYLVSRPPLER